MWNSEQDFPNVAVGQVRLKLTPYTDVVGYTDSTASFALDNYHQQSIDLAFIENLPFYEDTVEFSYTIQDTSTDTHRMRLYYQSDTSLWQAATLANDSLGFDTSRYSGTLQWLSAVDFVDVDIARVRVAANIFDGWQVGIRDTTDYFFLNDTIAPNVPPTIVLNKSIQSSEQSDDISIAYEVTDVNEDTVQIAVLYSVGCS